MKKIILLTALLTSSNCFSDDLRNFNEIKTAATSGKNIHIMIDFAKCTAPSSTQATVTTVFTPNALMIVNNRISTSLTHFTLNNPSYSGKPVYEFVKYIVTDDNSVQVTNQVLDAVSYAPLGDTSTFNCKIDAGARFYD
jgi:hypothetical protein